MGTLGSFRSSRARRAAARALSIGCACVCTCACELIAGVRDLSLQVDAAGGVAGAFSVASGGTSNDMGEAGSTGEVVASTTVGGAPHASAPTAVPHGGSSDTAAPRVDGGGASSDGGAAPSSDGGATPSMGGMAGMAGEMASGMAGEAGTCHDDPILAVAAPSFAIPDTGFYCNVVWPTAGASYWFTDYGDYNSNPCSHFKGARVMRAGWFTNNRYNIAQEWCDKDFYWTWQVLDGLQAINQVVEFAANAQTYGNCFFKNTIASELRGVEDTIVPLDYWSDPANSFALPKLSAHPHLGKAFDATYYQNAVRAAILGNLPADYAQPVGYQLSVRSPLTISYPAPLDDGLLVDMAVGKVVGNSLPPGTTACPGHAMDGTRRFELASLTNTITAVAALAAFDELAEHENPQQVSLESAINPYLQMIWPGGVDSSLQLVSFRDLLRHTTPLCASGRTGGETYLALKSLMSQGPGTPNEDGAWKPGTTADQPGLARYCSWNYALLRILLPLVLEGGAAFRTAYGELKTDTEIDALTAVYFRNYVRAKIFDPIGLTDVDEYFTGAALETIYYTAAGVAIPDRVNVGRGANWGYDSRANTTVRSAGAGFWYLSANEYSFFLANLWAGNIIPKSSVLELLTPGEFTLGMDGRNKMYGQYTFGKSGAGSAGGPATQWVTFPDGYVAVLLSNSPIGDIRAILEQNYDAAWQ